MVDIEQCVIEAIEEIIGLPQEELRENLDLDLKAEGLLDSVSCASLIAIVEGNLARNFDYDKIELKNFTSINSIVKTFSNALI